MGIGFVLRGASDHSGYSIALAPHEHPKNAGYSSNHKPLTVIYAVTLPQDQLSPIIPVKYAVPFGLGRQARHHQAVCLPVARHETVQHVECC